MPSDSRPPNDIFAQPIFGLAEEQQFLFGQLGILFDSIDLRYQTLRRSLIRFHAMPPADARTKDLILGATNDAWRIVDCFYQAGKLLGLFDAKRSQSNAIRVEITALTLDASVAGEAIFKLMDSVSALRNKMDHLGSNVSNLLASARRSPLHGAIGFVHIPDDSFTTMESHTLISGPITKFSSHLVNPLDLAGKTFLPPVDFIHFSAFTHTVNLTALVEECGLFRSSLNKLFQDGILGHIDQTGMDDSDKSNFLGYPSTYLHLVATFGSKQDQE